MSRRKPRRTKIFISYSHQDAAWLERLRVHLRPLERDYGTEIWDDTRIQTGSRWREEIRLALESSAVAILLVSADFLGSDFIARDELPPLLKAAEEEGAVILPLILSPSGFKRHAALSEFQAFNDPATPLINLPMGGQEAQFEKVAERVAALLGAPAELRHRRTKASQRLKTKLTSGKRQTQAPKTNAARPQRSGRELHTYRKAAEDASVRNRPGVKREERLGYWLVIAAIALGALAFSIVLATRQSGNRTEGMTSINKPYPAQSDTPRAGPGPIQAQSVALRATVEKGGRASVFNGSLKIRLDGIRLDEATGQYVVSFTLSSANSKEMKVKDGDANSDTTYNYPQDGRFKIQVVSAEENTADFSILRTELPPSNEK